MNILFSTCLKSKLDEYYKLPKDTYIYVPNLTFNGGIDLIREALERDDIKVYKGDARRKTEKSKWLQHLTVGAMTPTVFQIRLSNGVKILDYAKFDPSPDVKEEDALELARLLVEKYEAPITPTAIIRQQVPYLNIVQNRNKYGTIVKQPDGVVNAYTHNALFGGGVYNMRRNGAYKKVQQEVHVDFHQMYAYILKNYPFPDVRHPYHVVIGYVPHPFAIYHLCGGHIKLKKDGFPLLALERDKDNEREEVFSDYAPIPWQYLTDPDLKTILNNFDVDPENPLEIDETFYYDGTVSGQMMFGDFIDTVYANRQEATNPAVKRFYKMLNEYLPGSFERKVEDGRFWEELSGPAGVAQRNNYNSMVGAFITAYGRQLLDGLLHDCPYDKVVGYDTDCVFLRGTVADVPERVMKRFGDLPGQLHFDGIYTDVRHLSAKQYYGLEDGKPFGKFSAVPHGDEIAAQLIGNNDNLVMTPVTQSLYVWNVDEQCYDLTEIPARISLDNYNRESRPIPMIRGEYLYE